MPTHRVIASTETDPEAPLTSSLAKAWTDNAEAIREGDPTAPKIQPQALRHIPIISGTGAATQTFTGLGDYSGVEFEVFATNTSTGAGQLQFSYSTDGGATFSAVQALGGVQATSGRTIFRGFFDFATGQLRAVSAATDIASAVRTSVTMAGASLSIDAIRFNQAGGSTATCIAIVIPNGGAA